MRKAGAVETVEMVNRIWLNCSQREEFLIRDTSESESVRISSLRNGILAPSSYVTLENPAFRRSES